MRVSVNNVVSNYQNDSVKKFAQEFRKMNIENCGFSRDVAYKSEKKQVNFYKQPELAFAGHPASVKSQGGFLNSIINLLK